MTYVRSNDGTLIHYSKTGNPKGAPVLFIQGLGAGKTGWALQRLASAPWYQAIALDNRGAGRSDKPHGEYTLEQMADDAIAVLDHQIPRRMRKHLIVYDINNSGVILGQPFKPENSTCAVLLDPIPEKWQD